MFLFVLFFTGSYFALTEKYKASFISMLPAFLVYFLVAGYQYDVGTDYFNYVNIYDNEARHEYYYNKGEYLFFYLNQLLRSFHLSSQSLFISMSFIQAFLLFLYFKKIKKRGFVLWLFFMIFFSVTNIYNNQLNGLRQYVVISGLPLLTLYIYEKKYTKSLMLLTFLAFFHNSGLLLIALYPAIYLQNKFDKSLFFLFVLSGVGCFFGGNLLFFSTDLIFPSYSHYLQSDYAESRNIILFITKLYYLPIIFYFFAIYRKESSSIYGNYIHAMLYLFVLTYWCFLLALSLGIATRLYSYVIFFYTFPIYYIMQRSFHRGRVIEFILIGFYVVFPYVLKVTIFAKAEFLYKSILWN